MFYPFSIKVNKRCGSCNNINDPYAKLCVPDTIKNINVKVFILMSFSNQTKHIKWHKLVNANVDQMQVFVTINKDGMKINVGVNVEKNRVIKKRCDKGFIWNASNCNCECDKSCDIGEYLDHKNCKCRRKIVDSLVEECNKNIDDGTLNISLSDYKCNCFTLCIVLFVVFLVTSIVISSAFIYFYWYSKKNFTNFSC